MTPETLQSLIDKRFGGLLRYGSHQPDGEACALEAANVLLTTLDDYMDVDKSRKAWTDSPGRLPDLCRLSDAFGKGDAADKVRTAALVPVMAALWDWQQWTAERKVKFAELLAVGTVRDVLSLSLELRGHVEASEECRKVTTLSEARFAADAAYAYAADAANAAATAAAYAANAAADVADDAYAAAADAAAAAAYAAAAADAANAAADADKGNHVQVLHAACAVWLQAANDSATAAGNEATT